MNQEKSPKSNELRNPSDEDVEEAIASGDIELMKQALIDVNKANHRLGMDPSGMNEIGHLRRGERLYYAIRGIEPNFSTQQLFNQ